MAIQAGLPPGYAVGPDGTVYNESRQPVGRVVSPPQAPAYPVPPPGYAAAPPGVIAPNMPPGPGSSYSPAEPPPQRYASLAPPPGAYGPQAPPPGGEIPHTPADYLNTITRLGGGDVMRGFQMLYGVLNDAGKGIVPPQDQRLNLNQLNQVANIFGFRSADEIFKSRQEIESNPMDIFTNQFKGMAQGVLAQMGQMDLSKFTPDQAATVIGAIMEQREKAKTQPSQTAESQERPGNFGVVKAKSAAKKKEEDATGPKTAACDTALTDLTKLTNLKDHPTADRFADLKEKVLPSDGGDPKSAMEIDLAAQALKGAAKNDATPGKADAGKMGPAVDNFVGACKTPEKTAAASPPPAAPAAKPAAPTAAA